MKSWVKSRRLLIFIKTYSHRAILWFWFSYSRFQLSSPNYWMDWHSDWVNDTHLCKRHTRNFSITFSQNVIGTKTKLPESRSNDCIAEGNNGNETLNQKILEHFNSHKYFMHECNTYIFWNQPTSLSLKTETEPSYILFTKSNFLSSLHFISLEFH